MMQVTHPGIVVTSIVTLYWIVAQAYMVGIYFARLVGGVWSTADPYLAAMSASWMALASAEEIKAKEEEDGGGRGKWGSATTALGFGTIKRTEVPQFGVNGSGMSFQDTWWGGPSWWRGGYIGRKGGSVDATKEDVETFTAQGAEAWRYMEDLRIDWEKRLEEHEQ